MDDHTEELPETGAPAPLASTETAAQRRYERHDLLRIAIEAHGADLAPQGADAIVETARKFAAFADEV